MDKRWFVVAAVGSATFVTSLDTAVLNTALPSIRADLCMSLTDMERIGASFLVTYASLIPAGGRMADRFGRKRILLCGLLLFGCSSVFAASAWSSGSLITARILQGASAALISPTCLALIGATFKSVERKKRDIAVGVWLSLAATAVAVGPPMGGLISQYADWRYIFWINVPTVGMSALLAVAGVCERSDVPRRKTVGLGGIALAACAILGTVVTLLLVQDRGPGSPPVFVSATFAIITALAFVLHERRTDDPLINEEMRRSRTFMGGLTVCFIAHFSLMGAYFYSAIFIQQALGYSPTRAGLIFVAFSLLMLLGVPVATRVCAAHGTHVSTAAGLLTMAIGIGLSAAAGTGINYLELNAVFGLIGAGYALMTTMSGSALAVVPESGYGTASGLLDTARELSSLFGIICAGTILMAEEKSSLAGGATTGEAFVSGYRTALTAAAITMAAGAAIGSILLTPRTDDRRSSSPAHPAHPLDTPGGRSDHDPSGK
ncbi:MFS transporter [Actinomadura rupiterrae]|uniref:MFS transporter n=1 Tax=Actinomadura rupiterrae TaxID=559627 RepID=UPI0020A35B6F|nr:MFS transporter [Actinomadura rupiterrae]MCP2340682.1 MFS family permease [Actinomadura rupiterrae]